jgi:hypothetical protein
VEAEYGKILLGHYRDQRRHFAGDERLRHQPLTKVPNNRVRVLVTIPERRCASLSQDRMPAASRHARSGAMRLVNVIEDSAVGYPSFRALYVNFALAGRILD